MNVRKQIVLRTAEQTAFELREAYLGKCLKILTEARDEINPSHIHGHTENFLPVWVDDQSLQPNQIVDVEMIANTPVGLQGKIV